MTKSSRLGDITSVITKGTTPTSVGFDFSDYGVPFLRVQNLADGAVDLTKTPLYISEATHKELARSTIYPGDVLISIAGTIGRAAIVADDADEMNSNQAVGIVRLNDGVHRRYILHWLQSHEAKKQILGAQVTATISNLSLTELRNLQIPIPPLAKQKHIAAILDKADAIRRKLQQSLSYSDDYLRSVFLDMFGDPVTNPKGWTTMPITKACKFTSGATPSKANSEYWEGLIPWVSPKDMKRYWIDDSIDHVSEVALKNANLKSMAPGAILIVVRGMILAHSFPVAQTREKVTINQDMKALTPLHGLKSEYVAWSLRCQKHKILSLVSNAGHGTCRLDQESLSSVEIGIPDKELQNRFSLTVKKIAVFSERLTSQISEANNLFSSLQQRAFRGEL